MVCSSWSWPNMFDVARNRVSLYNDTASIVNRVKLLMLTEPTELFMTPNFGVGLKRYLFTYNNDNTIAIIKDRLIEQLRIWEPAVIPEDTTVTRGLNYTGQSSSGTSIQANNKLELTVTLKTRYMQTITFDLTENDLGGTQ